MVDLSVIVLSFNTSELTRKCLESICNKKWQKNVEVIVVDNASSDNSVSVIKRNFPQVKLIQSAVNLGFSAGNNLGLSAATAKYYLFLNSDTEVLDGSLDILTDFISSGDFAITSCKLLNPDKTLQPNGGYLPKPAALLAWLSGVDDVLRIFDINLASYHMTNKEFYDHDKQIGWVSGTAFCMSKETLELIGTWDDKIFMYAEDVEYCFRARQQGLSVGWTDKAQIIHIGGASSDNPKLRQWVGELRGLEYVYQKYYGWFAHQLIRVLFVFFIFLRVIAFFLIGKKSYAKTYFHVIKNI